MGIKAKIFRAASVVVQVATLGPLAAFTVPVTDIALSAAEDECEKEHSDDDEDSD